MTLLYNYTHCLTKVSAVLAKWPLIIQSKSLTFPICSYGTDRETFNITIIWSIKATSLFHLMQTAIPTEA
jgi:hypothetical protein